jgi:hypothetical protein
MLVAGSVQASSSREGTVFDKEALKFDRFAQNDRGFQAYNNFDLTGTNLRDLDGVDLQTCSANCQADAQCKAFSFDRWKGQCALKQEPGTFRFDPRSTSGIPSDSPTPSSATEATVMECFPGKDFKDADAYASNSSPSFGACAESALVIELSRFIDVLLLETREKNRSVLVPKTINDLQRLADDIVEITATFNLSRSELVLYGYSWGAPVVAQAVASGKVMLRRRPGFGFFAAENSVRHPDQPRRA